MFALLVTLGICSIPEMFTPEIIRQIDLELIKQCGGECVNTFHEIFPRLKNPADIEQTIDAIQRGFHVDLDLVKARAEEFENLVATTFAKQTKHQTTIKEHKVIANLTTAGGPPGTACVSVRECIDLSNRLNTCSDTRIMALKIYETVNKMVHAFQAVLRLSCACVFEGPVTVCALSGFPYTCSIFFNGYRGLFSTSRSMYTLSGTLVQTCGMLSGIVQ
jgi:hypothetical protein